LLAIHRQRDAQTLDREPWGSRSTTLSPSVDDRRLHQLAEQIAILAAQWARLPLGHPHDDHLLLRIDPERRAGGATPPILAGRSGPPVESRLLANGEAEAEAVAARQDRQRHPDVAEVVRCHLRHGGAAEDAGPVELAAVQEHLAEARVVRGRPR